MSYLPGSKRFHGSTLGVAALAAGAALALAIAPGVPAASADVVSFRNQAPAPFGSGNYGGAESTFIRQITPNDAYSAPNNRLFVRGANTAQDMAFMRWDVSALAGKYSSIDEVKVILHVVAVENEGDVFLHAVNDDNAGWTVGTGSRHLATAGESTWAFMQQFGYMDGATEVGDTSLNVPWNLAGGGTAAGLGSNDAAAGPDGGVYGYDENVLAGQLIPATADDDGAAPASFITFTLSDPSIVDHWITSGINAGLIGLGERPDADQSNIRFDRATLATGPELVVTYTAALVPEPATLALFGAGGLLMLSRRRRQGNA